MLAWKRQRTSFYNGAEHGSRGMPWNKLRFDVELVPSILSDQPAPGTVDWRRGCLYREQCCELLSEDNLEVLRARDRPLRFQTANAEGVHGHFEEFNSGEAAC